MNNANQIRKRDECETIKRQFMSQKIAVGEVYRMKKIVFDEDEQISVVLKFIFVETINAVIQRHFV